MEEQQFTEILSQIKGLRAEVGAVKGTLGEVKHLAEKTNGRVTALEGWQVQHDEEHKALMVIVEMAHAIAQIRRAVLFAIPFATFVGVVIGLGQTIW